MNAVADRLLLRFPILRRAYIRQGIDDLVEALPPFLGIFMAAMEAATTTPLCFVLPRKGDMARLAAVVYGLHRFAVSQAELTKRYGEMNFKPGEFVRIHPSRHVFCFLGFDPQHPDRIQLRPPNGGERDWWSIKAAPFVPRLERTTLTRPIGRMNTPIHDPDVAPLDRLLGSSTFGNQGLFRNEVVLLDSSTGFQRFIESTSLRPIEFDGEFPPLDALAPFGQISHARETSGASRIVKRAVGWERTSLRILSLGCTEEPVDARAAVKYSLGWSYWAWKCVEVFMAAQSSASLGTAAILAGHANILRICPVSGRGRFGLDKVREIGSLRGLGEAEARKALPNLREMFLGDLVEQFRPYRQ